jgi:hypothetical protein
LPQSFGPPGTQFPPLQKSFVVQGFPSLQDPVALVRTQLPVAWSQASIVQAFPSSQFAGGFEHVPPTGSHTSWVQGSPSLQSFAAPWQTTAPLGVVTQTSPSVQALPSSQLDPAARGCPAHRAASSQASPVVQEFWSSHAAPAPSVVPWHCPVESQASSLVQELRSSQSDPGPTREWRQPPNEGSGTQKSLVHGLPSSQFKASCRQVPVVVSHESTVQELKSVQSGQSMAGATDPWEARAPWMTSVAARARALTGTIQRRDFRVGGRSVMSYPPWN